MHIDELDYALPDERIATQPAEPRDAARLMVVHRDRPGPPEAQVEHHRVHDLPTLGVLRAGDLMVVNDTRVEPVRFFATRRGTGGRVEALYLSATERSRWRVLLRARGTLQAGELLDVDDDAAQLELVQNEGEGVWQAVARSCDSPLELLARVGQAPLPPYIVRARRRRGQPRYIDADRIRYNTVYARASGSAAAPTAGLHLTPQVLDALEARGVDRTHVTLHVGLGTFAPVRANTLDQHAMHAERIEVSEHAVAALQGTRAGGGRILAVGTTTVRALESLPEPARAFHGPTDLFIYPDSGTRFRFTDMLLTNFHLPRSTLLALVAALPGVGIERLKAWYALAVRERYRFYSYGDAMLIV